MLIACQSQMRIFKYGTWRHEISFHLKLPHHTTFCTALITCTHEHLRERAKDFSTNIEHHILQEGPGMPKKSILSTGVQLLSFDTGNYQNFDQQSDCKNLNFRLPSQEKATIV